MLQKITIQLPDSLKQEIIKIAKERDMSASQYTRHLYRRAARGVELKAKYKNQRATKQQIANPTNEVVSE